MVGVKYSNEDLKVMQSWSLDQKIMRTQTRIIEYCVRYDNKVYISFSGGKDSTVLLDLVRRVNPNIPAVFIDTGLEYPEIREFVKTIPNVIWLKPEMNFRTVIKTFGYPLIGKEVAQKIYEYRRNPNGYAADRFDPDSEYNKKYKGMYSMAKWTWLRDSDIPISHKCCSVMKKKPVRMFERESGLHPIIATMACESQLRKTEWRKKGCNAFDGLRPTSQPMSFWLEEDVLEYIKRYNLSYASVYGDIVKDADGKYHTTGCQRTGCVFCGFGCHNEKEPNRFQRLKQTHPKLWDYCMRSWDNGGLGMKQVLDCIGVKTE